MALGDLCSPKQWQALAKSKMTDSGYPVYGANGVIGFAPQFTHAEETILVGCRGSIGNVHVTSGKVYATSNAMALDHLRTDLVDLRFLARFLAWRGFRDETSGSSQPQLTRQNMMPVQVPVPPLDEQRRISALLEHADTLRIKRHETLGQFGDLTRSVFLEMFGDPARNPRRWDLAPLNDVSRGGGSYGANLPSAAYAEDLPRYVRITDVTDTGGLSSDPRSPGGEPKDWERYELSENDLLFARSGATVGKTYLHTSANGRCVYAGYLIRFQLREELVDPRYVFAFTKTQAYQAWVKSRQNVVAQPNINAKQYGNELLIPVPPLARQREFAQHAAAIGRVQHLADRAAEMSAELFNSLQSRVFGEGVR